ncbi:YlmH family RNA-binding protein [Sedimentibacter sp. MB31-C6]|uniref:YlmH family RNA-binding protein n=1 Tax=Sedimentibacter sp. MB31-C6 TaxID=3109366 RepID=UPI002DDD4D31|nr:YlmH/Sll1252 family protein [Sedimentibacter sp. MB36-C1]WSI04339.1 YlmH/Sll1252 family protein [Sedimentibacter sp. MB36-C1]
MKNIEKYYDYIKDEETKVTVKKIADKAAYVEKNYVSATTEFINPYVAELSLPIIKYYDINFELFPSFEDGERKVFIFAPSYFENIDESEFITGLRIKNKSKFRDLSHKDYLGTIMSLGIDRSKTGDIFVYEDYADIVIHRDILDYIIFNLDKIGHNKIETESIDINDINFKEQEHILLTINISSMRLDNLVKNLINKSRELACNIIKSGHVKINWQVEDRISKNIKECDIISISKYGRFKVHRYLGVTKSGKHKIEIKHYV